MNRNPSLCIGLYSKYCINISYIFTVFEMLLGNTIIIDNLNAATHYRKEVCITIVRCFVYYFIYIRVTEKEKGLVKLHLYFSHKLIKAFFPKGLV